MDNNAQLEQLCEQQKIAIDWLLWSLALNNADITDVSVEQDN